jgi:hypothetical protein
MVIHWNLLLIQEEVKTKDNAAALGPPFDYASFFLDYRPLDNRRHPDHGHQGSRDLIKQLVRILRLG